MRMWIGAACALLTCLLGLGCSSDDGNGSGVCRTGTYQLNPNGSASYVLMRDYRFRCRDTSFEPEILLVYEECTDASGIVTFYEGGANVTFQAQLGNYRFVGSVVREFGVGVGPFASGTYERTNGSTTLEVGSFSFTEGEMEPPGMVQCQP